MLESNSNNNENDRNTNNNCSRIHQFYGEELLAISKHDPLHELTVQEKDLVWKVREYCSDNLPTM